MCISETSIHEQSTTELCPLPTLPYRLEIVLAELPFKLAKKQSIP